MCGIVGTWGTPDAALTGRLLDSIAHRGPDGHGDDRRPRGVVGHRRLAIMDPEGGAQPIPNDAGSMVVCANGEIYNFPALRREIGATRRWRTGSDSEAILHLFESHDTEATKKLRGMYAFAILGDDRLVLARDPIGIKPLYLGVGPGSDGTPVLAFSSELTGLCEWAGEVREFPPGYVFDSRSGFRRFARPPAPAQEHGEVDDHVRHVRESLERAVTSHLMSDVPVGAFLSGGLDSSAVVAFARELTPDLQCFTIRAGGGVDRGVADDLPYATRVARQLGVKLHVIEIEASRMAADLERMVWQLDEPLADPAPLNVLYICELARQNGMKVLLSGAGGDDLFTGYRRHRALELQRYWDWMPRGVRGLIESTTARLDQRRAWSRRLAKLANGAGLDGDERIANYFRWSRESDLFALYSAETRRAIGAHTALEPMLDFMRPLPAATHPLERMLALEQRFFLSDHNLPYTDKMSMAVGVEVRVPLLDLELVEFAARIPPGVKQKGKVGKWVFKKAMEPYLPHDVIYRPKSGFGAPLRKWMRDELRPLVGDLLGRDSLERRGLFDAKAVHRLIDSNQSGTVDASYTLLSLLSIEVWCRKYVD